MVAICLCESYYYFEYCILNDFFECLRFSYVCNKGNEIVSVVVYILKIYIYFVVLMPFVDSRHLLLNLDFLILTFDIFTLDFLVSTLDFLVSTLDFYPRLSTSGPYTERGGAGGGEQGQLPPPEKIKLAIFRYCS